MYNDILGDEEKIKEPTEETILESMKANIEGKEQMINDLVDKITELERKVEDLENL
jgi:hypothetical protein